MNRREFLKAAAALPFLSPRSDSAPGAANDETLYNGVRLAAPWPPRRAFPDDDPIAPPYLADRPSVVPIDLGRQLFVDDFLIEETTLSRSFHLPDMHPASPVLRPTTPWEQHDEYADRTRTNQNFTAMVFSDGVFFDPDDGLFKMWYMGGFREHTCLALSKDGVNWDRPSFDYRPGTNIVMGFGRDSSTVWLDLFAGDRSKRYKMAIFRENELTLHVSADGIHWRTIGETGYAGDRTTFFYNPFRRVWVFGIRSNQFQFAGRFRTYWEHPQFEKAHKWGGIAPVAWVKADTKDPFRPDMGRAPELYNLDCVAYESVMLGLFTIWRGESRVREKINEVVVGYSRDGFHWHRPDRRSFLTVSETPGAWNWANVQSAGGCCLIVGDKLYFYMSGRAGVPGTEDPGTCSTGLATLRRDGFASMDAALDQRVRRLLPSDKTGTMLITRPVKFGGRHLFVNADATGGELRVEVLDRQGKVIRGFDRASSVPFQENSTRTMMRWSANADLSKLAGEDVRFRFWLTRGRLFAFWVSSWPTGESRGLAAAGGPGFKGPVDER